MEDRRRDPPAPDPAGRGRPGWRALLDGADAARAVETATDIAAALLAEPAPGGAPVSPYLASGALGVAVFLTALAEATSDSKYVDAAARLLDGAVARTAELTNFDIGVFGAPVGVGWTVAVLAGRLDGMPEAPHDETDVDRFVDRVLDLRPWPGPLDHVHGLVGLGTYALARLPAPPARRALDRIVAHLAAAAVEDAAGTTWAYVPPDPDAYEFSAPYPPGHIDVGFAHGVAGIVAFLAAADEAGAAGAGALLRPAAGWLAAQRLASTAAGSFPSKVVAGRPASGTRMAWCYGDLGVAHALLSAGLATADEDLVRTAVEIARGCADRTSTGIADAGLCHGSAGAGHLLNRLGQAVGDGPTLEAARRWFADTFARRRPDLPVAGFPRARQAADGAVSYVADSGLLTGAAGVGLALLAAARDAEPWWDQLLLVRPTGTWHRRRAKKAAY